MHDTARPNGATHYSTFFLAFDAPGVIVDIRNDVLGLLAREEVKTLCKRIHRPHITVKVRRTRTKTDESHICDVLTDLVRSRVICPQMITLENVKYFRAGTHGTLYLPVVGNTFLSGMKRIIEEIQDKGHGQAAFDKPIPHITLAKVLPTEVGKAQRRINKELRRRIPRKPQAIDTLRLMVYGAAYAHNGVHEYVWRLSE